MKKMIIYDLDGTLVDTREDIVRSINYLREVMEMPPLPSREIEAFVGYGLHHLLASCLKTHDSTVIQKAAPIYRNYYAKHMLDSSRLYQDAYEMLEGLKSRIQIVFTNKPNPFTKDLLNSLNVLNYFQWVIAGDSEFPKKPAPDAVYQMMEKFNVSSEEILFVGDSPIDIQTARAAKVNVWVLAHGFSTRSELAEAKPDAIYDSFQRLYADFCQKGW